MTSLVRLDHMIGLIAVGMLVAALASVSVRPEKPPTHEELLLRRAIMRIGLALAAALLVVAVLCTKVLIESPHPFSPIRSKRPLLRSVMRRF
jgi:hypothetical protein